MIDYLILRFLWLRERGFVQITKDLGFALSIFSDFRNYSGDFTICFFGDGLYQSAVFSF